MREIYASTPVAQAPLGANDVLRVLFDQHFAVELALTPHRIDEVLALRYQVYCCERPFEDANCFPDGRECDAYDERSVHALVRHRASGACVAAVRLVLADEHEPTALFPMEAHCREAIPPTGLTALENTPRKRIAEISRLAVSRNIRQRMGQTGSDDPEHAPELDQHIMPYIIVGLFAAIVRLSAKLSVTHWMAVMEPTLLRLLKRYGICFPHVGPVIDYHGRRRPAIAQARTLVDGIRAARPAVWALITDGGTVLPARPSIPIELHSETRALTFIKNQVAGEWLLTQAAWNARARGLQQRRPA